MSRGVTARTWEARTVATATALAIQGDEFDLERFAPAVNVHHRAHVAGFETFFGEVAGQNDPIMFLHHVRPRTAQPKGVLGRLSHFNGQLKPQGF